MSPKTENENKTKEMEYQYNSSNPFLAPIVEHIEDSKHRKVIGQSFQDVIDKPTGAISKQKILVLGEQKVVDNEQYCKLYMGQIRSFFGLSKKALMMLQYIMDNIKYSDDKICLYYPHLQESLGLIKSTMYGCVNQLLKAGIIARASTPGCYYINPAVVFKGDRIAIVQQFVRNNIPNEYDLLNMPDTITDKEIDYILNEQTGEVTDKATR